VHVPFRLVKRGGRNQMVLPVDRSIPRQTDDTLVKALARAFRWKRMLESGEYATINELAEREGIAPSYMTRVLRLTLGGDGSGTQPSPALKSLTLFISTQFRKPIASSGSGIQMPAIISDGRQEAAQRLAAS